jgi:CRISPR-associated protein Cas10/Cmr2 subtype III-B
MWPAPCSHFGAEAGPGLQELAEELARRGLPPTLFDEGEHLCPYCLVKRLLLARNVLARAVEQLLGLKVEPSTLTLSTSDVAAAWWIVYAASSLRGRDLKELAEELLRACGAKDDYRDLLGPYAPVVEEFGDAARLLAALWCYGVEEARAEGKVKVLEGVAGPPPSYYAIVKGDGDFVGRRLLRGVLGLKPPEYVDMVLRNVPETVRERARKGAEQLVERLAGTAQATTLVTPAYLYTLSRGLMAVAVLDAALATSLLGVLVYSGGDDVVALLPAWAPRASDVVRAVESHLGKHGLRRELLHGLVVAGEASVPVAALATILSRWIYWGLHGGSPGFIRLAGTVLVQAPTAYGRSYGVLVTHYRDPLYTAFRMASALSELKREAEVEWGRDRLLRDVVVVAYGRLAPGMEREAAVIPNRAGGSESPKSVGEPLATAVGLSALVSLGALSSNLYHDYVQSYRELVIRAWERNATTVAVRLVARLIERNTDVSAADRYRSAYDKLTSRLGGYVAASVVRPATAPLLDHVLRALYYLLAGRRGGS